MKWRSIGAFCMEVERRFFGGVGEFNIDWKSVKEVQLSFCFDGLHFVCICVEEFALKSNGFCSEKVRIELIWMIFFFPQGYEFLWDCMLWRLNGKFCWIAFRLFVCLLFVYVEKKIEVLCMKFKWLMRFVRLRCFRAYNRLRYNGRKIRRRMQRTLADASRLKMQLENGNVSDFFERLELELELIGLQEKLTELKNNQKNVEKERIFQFREKIWCEVWLVWCVKSFLMWLFGMFVEIFVGEWMMIAENFDLQRHLKRCGIDIDVHVVEDLEDIMPWMWVLLRLNFFSMWDECCVIFRLLVHWGFEGRIVYRYVSEIVWFGDFWVHFMRLLFALIVFEKLDCFRLFHCDFDVSVHKCICFVLNFCVCGWSIVLVFVIHWICCCRSVGI